MKLTHPTIIAISVVVAGLMIAAFIVEIVTPTPAPVVSAGALADGRPTIQVVGPDGVTYAVPATLPPDCRTAYVQVAPPLMAARAALKAILKGEPAADHADALTAAFVALRGHGSTTPAAILDCGSQDITAATAYRKAGDAVQTADATARLVGRRPAPRAIDEFEDDLTVIEIALAQL